MNDVKFDGPVIMGWPGSPTDMAYNAGCRAGWELAVQWLHERATSHAGRWMTMDPREALKVMVEEMRTIHV